MRTKAAAVVLSAGILLIGCSDDEKPAGEGTESSVSAEPTSSTIPPVNLCNELTPAALDAITTIDFGPGTFDGHKCDWTTADGSHLVMSVQEEPLLSGFFVVVSNKGGQPVTVGEAVRAQASLQPDNGIAHVLLAVETHPGIGITLSLMTPVATIDQAVLLAEQVFSAANY